MSKHSKSHSKGKDEDGSGKEDHSQIGEQDYRRVSLQSFVSTTPGDRLLHNASDSLYIDQCAPAFLNLAESIVSHLQLGRFSPYKLAAVLRRQSVEFPASIIVQLYDKLLESVHNEVSVFQVASWTAQLSLKLAREDPVFQAFLRSLILTSPDMATTMVPAGTSSLQSVSPPMAWPEGARDIYKSVKGSVSPQNSQLTFLANTQEPEAAPPSTSENQPSPPVSSAAPLDPGMSPNYANIDGIRNVPFPGEIPAALLGPLKSWEENPFLLQMGCSSDILPGAAWVGPERGPGYDPRGIPGMHGFLPPLRRPEDGNVPNHYDKHLQQFFNITGVQDPYNTVDTMKEYFYQGYDPDYLFTYLSMTYRQKNGPSVIINLYNSSTFLAHLVFLVAMVCTRGTKIRKILAKSTVKLADDFKKMIALYSLVETVPVHRETASLARVCGVLPHLPVYAFFNFNLVGSVPLTADLVTFPHPLRATMFFGVLNTSLEVVCVAGPPDNPNFIPRCVPAKKGEPSSTRRIDVTSRLQLARASFAYCMKFDKLIHNKTPRYTADPVVVKRYLMIAFHNSIATEQLKLHTMQTMGLLVYNDKTSLFSLPDDKKDILKAMIDSEPEAQNFVLE